MWNQSSSFRPLDRLSDRWRLVLAGVFTVVFLGLAGLLVYRARTIDRDDLGCSDRDPNALLAVGSLLVVAPLGFWVFVANARRLG